MIYEFDASSFFELNAYYPSVFKALWARIDAAVKDGVITSTREVRREIERGDADVVAQWAKANMQVFSTPGSNETAFVAQIFAVKHFQQMISKKAQQRGDEVADPFVIACAKIKYGTVVTEERLKPHAAKIPNVCKHFGIPCTNLEGFMKAQNWTF